MKRKDIIKELEENKKMLKERIDFNLNESISYDYCEGAIDYINKALEMLKK